MANQEVGLDEYEVRNARGWDRHMILALLSVVWAASLSLPDPKKSPRGRAAWRISGGCGGVCCCPWSRTSSRCCGLVALAPVPPVGGPALPLPAAGQLHLNWALFQSR